MSERILIVEDDPTLRMGLEDSFKLEGYDVLVAAEGGQAEDYLYGRHIDLVLLDVMLPNRGGLEILRGLRARGLKVPVILLTARSSENDKVLGLELGADDYVTKPFSLRELLARVRVALRRQEEARSPGAANDAPVNFTIGDAVVDLGKFRLTRGGLDEPLTKKEAEMLRLLYEAQGKVVSRRRFLVDVWDGGAHVSTRTVDTHILNLRKKIEDDPKSPHHIVTVHGVGYRLSSSSRGDDAAP